MSRIIGGDCVEHIGNSAFYATRWLKDQGDFAIVGSTLYKYLGNCADVLIPEQIHHIADYAFAKTNVEGVKGGEILSIGEGAFYQCKSLREAVLPLENVPPFCFYGCEKLKNRFSVSDIGKFGLYGCSSVTSITVQTIGVCAMAFCSSLKEVYDIKSIATGAFFSCGSLKEILLKDVRLIGKFALSETAIAGAQFAGDLIDDFAFYNSPRLSGVKIKNTAKIGKAILYGCNQVGAMSIGGKIKLTAYFGGKMPLVTKLFVYGDIVDDFCRNNPYLTVLQLWHTGHFGRWSFYHNTLLSQVLLTDVVTIGDWAFAYCNEIRKIILPQTVTFIGMNAFRYCHNLSDITIESKQCVPFGANAFYSTAEEKIFTVKAGMSEQYQRIPIWAEYVLQKNRRRRR